MRLLLMALVIWAMCAPASLFAQADPKKKGTKREVKVELDKAKFARKKPTLGKQAASFGKAFSAADFVSKKKLRSRKKLDEAISRVKKLLEVTPETHPSRAEFLFNLAELYFQKAKRYGLEAYAKQDECYQLEDAKKTSKARVCKVVMQEMIEESKRLRIESNRHYGTIITNHPNFKHIDEVYYYKGANHQELNERATMINLYKDLINKHPKSRFIPNVLLAFGDYYFDADEMADAAKFYDKVTSTYPNSAVYAYASYKKGWCFFNTNNKEKALQQFLATLKFSKSRPDLPNSRPLIKRARNDIVVTYAFVGAASKAIPFFKKITKTKNKKAWKAEWIKMAERLAAYYSDKGKFDESSLVYRSLIKSNNRSVKVIDYQYEIVRNETSKNAYSEASLKQIVLLMKLVQLLPKKDDPKKKKQQFLDYDADKFKPTMRSIEEFSRRWATIFHIEAQKTKNPNLYTRAYYIYKTYVNTFPNSETMYHMTFFFGELLYRLKQYEEAAAQYERVLTINPKGKYSKDAIFGTVLSYFKYVEVSEKVNKDGLDQAIQNSDPDAAKTDKKKLEIPKKKPLTGLQKRFLRACERYAELAPDGEKIEDVRYTMARIYYEHNHLQKAAKAFKDIAYKHPKHRLAIIAANLHLDSLNLMQDYEQMEREAKEYRDKKPIKDPAFIADVNKLYEQISFMKCTVLDKKKEWRKAAQCYVAFYRDSPKSKYVTKSLYNAALDYERLRDLGKAIKIRVFLLGQIQNVPDMDPKTKYEIASKTLYNIAGNYHAMAIYGRAATAYEKFAQVFPKDKKAEGALANASTFRHGLGQYDRAIEDYERWLELFGKDNPKKAQHIRFEIGRAMKLRARNSRDRLEVYEYYKKFVYRYRRNKANDYTLNARLHLAKYMWKRGGRRNREEALKEFKKLLRSYDRLSKKDREALTTGRDAAAEAKFHQAEVAFKEMQKIKVNSSSPKGLKKQLNKKVKAMKKGQKMYTDIILFRRPDWAIASLYRLGSQMADLAKTIRSSKCPKRLTYEQCEIYQGLLEDQASQVENGAVSFYEKALDVARKNSWFNKFTRAAQVELAQIRPKKYRKPSEVRAEPDHVPTGVRSNRFITKLKAEDSLREFGKETDAGDDDTTKAKAKDGAAPATKDGAAPAAGKADAKTAPKKP